MNKKISTSITAIIIIFILIILASLFKGYNDDIKPVVSQKAEPKEQSKCVPRAFAGEAKVKGWYVEEDNKKLVKIASSDLAKLPLEKDKVRIIDADQNTDKKLSNSSEEKPASLTITGFADLCNGVALASINYKDKIFQPYMNN